MLLLYYICKVNFIISLSFHICRIIYIMKLNQILKYILSYAGSTLSGHKPKTWS